MIDLAPFYLVNPLPGTAMHRKTDSCRSHTSSSMPMRSVSESIIKSATTETSHLTLVWIQIQTLRDFTSTSSRGDIIHHFIAPKTLISTLSLSTGFIQPTDFLSQDLSIPIGNNAPILLIQSVRIGRSLLINPNRSFSLKEMEGLGITRRSIPQDLPG